MSKRASDAALKAYPPTYSEGNRHPKRVQSMLVDTHQPLRTIFQRAYEPAEKRMTCKWLRNGEECGKGLTGTPCEVKGCVAWEHYDKEEQI